MSRVTKYPLVLHEIIKYTPTEHPEYEALLDAHNRLKTLCATVNSNVRAAESEKALNWCAKHVQLNTHLRQNQFTFNASTNVMGARQVSDD